MILCQRLPCVKGAPRSGEGLFCVDYRFLQSLRHGKPCHLPLHKGRLFYLTAFCGMRKPIFQNVGRGFTPAVTKGVSEILRFAQNDGWWRCKATKRTNTPRLAQRNGGSKPPPYTANILPRSRSEHIAFCVSKKYRVHREVNIYSSLAESVRFRCFRT